MDKNKYVLLVLAAGSSERLGRPKQLVKWNQSTLLNHTIEQALNTENTDVFVALGGNQIDILPTISRKVPILTIHNWHEGMGSSIAKSMSRINIENYKGIILSVCDQPYISYDIFNKLINKFEKEKSSIIISKYEVATGPPTLFSRIYFNDLLELKGDNGAKKIVKKHNDEIDYILFPTGEIDIDSEADLKILNDLK